MKLIIDVDEEWYSNIIASKDHIDEDDEAYLILNGKLYEERLQGDLISREALKKAVYVEFGNSNLTDAFNDIIDNAPSVSDSYAEGYAQGYIDGSIGKSRKEKKNDC